MAPPDEHPSLDAQTRIGMVLKGKWTIDKLLGVGGMASVYLATHRNGSKVAVKILHAHLGAHPDTLRRFLREGYLSNKVEHPDVVHVLDDDIAPDGAPFLVMELLDGKSLDNVLEERGPLVVREAVDLVSKILTVLEAAHEKGIVHRDLKPANVFLLKNGSIKVLDFGIARLHEVTASHAATMGGTVLGTPAFMPPEQARGRWDDVDARSDLWAMGATLFMLLTNRSVREEAETANEALMYAMAKPVAPMAELLPALPRPIAAVIDRSLAFDKAARWPSAAAMKEALASALEAAGRGVGDTIIDRPVAASPLQTGEASSFVHVHTPGGLGPGGALAGTTPSSMPPGSGGALAPLPLFTRPHVHVAPATTPQLQLRSLTPTSQSSELPRGGMATQSSGKTSKVAVAGLAMLGLLLVAVVMGAVLLAREERPVGAAKGSASAETTATTATATAATAATSATTASSITIGDPPAPSGAAAGSTTPGASATAKKRPPPTAKNPLDQGRF
ncbi:MAG TPA: serine/threonine-protein kinase [Labilithrix sp.]|nr:serine/threonine-protein kinase [Labilithrix sp.]